MIRFSNSLPEQIVFKNQGLTVYLFDQSRTTGYHYASLKRIYLRDLKYTDVKTIFCL